jgi:hypothetical protein
MGQLRAAVRAYARLDMPPADVLELLDGVVRDLTEDAIVTCIYAVYDPLDRSLTFASAGHLPPLLATPAGSVHQVDREGKGRRWEPTCRTSPPNASFSRRVGYSLSTPTGSSNSVAATSTQVSTSSAGTSSDFRTTRCPSYPICSSTGWCPPIRTTTSH